MAETFAAQVAEARRILGEPSSTYDDQDLVQLRFVLDHIITALEALADDRPVMTQHDHAAYVEGCFRCDLAANEGQHECPLCGRLHAAPKPKLDYHARRFNCIDCGAPGRYEANQRCRPCKIKQIAPMGGRASHSSRGRQKK